MLFSRIPPTISSAEFEMVKIRLRNIKNVTRQITSIKEESKVAVCTPTKSET